jgi:hypothetical protein
LRGNVAVNVAVTTSGDSGIEIPTEAALIRN